MIVLLIISWPVVSTHRFLGFDDFALVDPLRSVQSLHDYATAWRTNKILDVAPIRDLSYWTDLQLAHVFGMEENFHLTNILLWFATSLVFFRILLRAGIVRPVALLTTFVIATHPVIHNAVFWIAGRKHILSALFISLSVAYLMKWSRKRDSLLSFAFYTLAIFAQPINVGFPLFAFFYLWYQDRLNEAKSKIYLIMLMTTGALTAFINARYFSSDAYQNTGGLFAPKFRAESLDLIAKRFLIWGRDVLQIIGPVRPSVVSYNLQSALSYVGLIILFALLVAARRKLYSISPWLLFVALPVATVTAKLTSQGGVDTYLLTPLLGCGVILAITLQAVKANQSKLFFPIGLVVVVIFSVQNFSMAKIWSNRTELWKYAYESEGSTSSKVLYARELVNEEPPKLTEAISLAQSVRREKPNEMGLGYILGKAIYISATPYEEKQRMFLDNSVNDAWFDYYQSAADAKNSNYARAAERLDHRWTAEPEKSYIELMFNIDDFEKKWTLMCENALLKECEAIHGKIDTQKRRIENASRGF